MIKVTLIYQGFSQTRTQVEITREVFHDLVMSKPEVVYVKFTNADGSWEYVDIRKPLAIKVEDEQHI